MNPAEKKQIELDKYKRTYNKGDGDVKIDTLSLIDDFDPYTLVDALTVFWPYIATSLLVTALLSSLNPTSENYTDIISCIVCLLFLIIGFILIWADIKKNTPMLSLMVFVI